MCIVLFIFYRERCFLLNSVADVWDNVLQQLKKDLSETTIATWFDELEAVDIRGNTFILHCANDFKKGYIESLFLKNIKSVLHDIFSTDFEVEILDDLSFEELRGNVKKQSDRFTSDEFTFDTFVVGPSNKLATPPPRRWPTILPRITTLCSSTETPALARPT